METQTSLHPPAARWTFPLAILAGYLYPVVLYAIILLFIKQNQTARYFAAIGSGILFAAFALWLCKKEGISWRELGLTLPKLLESVLLLAACWAIYALISFMIAGKSWFGQRADIASLIQQWFFVALGEELFFRGYLYNRFKTVFQNRPKLQPTLLAGLVSSAIFSTYHIPNRIVNGFGFIDLLISLLMVLAIGIFFAYFYMRSGSIIFAALVHGSWNVPLFGPQGDFFLFIVFAIVMEVYLLSKKRVENRE